MGLLRGVKMQMRRVRDVEKAGGIEGLLVRLLVAAHICVWSLELGSWEGGVVMH
jgi:hypothetical protein